MPDISPDPNFLNRWLSRTKLFPLRRTRASINLPLSRVSTDGSAFFQVDVRSHTSLPIRYIYALPNNVALRIDEDVATALDSVGLVFNAVSLFRVVPGAYVVSQFDPARGVIGTARYNVGVRYQLNNRHGAYSATYMNPPYDGQLLYGNGLIIEAWIPFPSTNYQFTANTPDIQIPTSILGSKDIRYDSDSVIQPVTTLYCAPPKKDINFADGTPFALPMIPRNNPVGNVTLLPR